LVRQEDEKINTRWKWKVEQLRVKKKKKLSAGDDTGARCANSMAIRIPDLSHCGDRAIGCSGHSWGGAALATAIGR
jgi:hypothetical protein